MHTPTLRRTIAALFGALTVFITSFVSAAANLYVSTSGSDSNPGTQAAPFRTIAKGSRAATAGTTVHVAPGTYTETIRTNQRGTASSRIRFVSDVKWGAKILPSNPTGESVWDVRGSYIDIDGFNVDGTNCTSCIIGINLAGSYDRALNSHVHHIATNFACNSNGAAAILTDGYYGGVSNDATGNVVDNVGPGLGQCDFDQGIYIATSGLVANNIVSGVSECGIHLYHNATAVTIVNNTVFSNGCGIVVGSGEYYSGFTGPGDYNKTTNNIVYNNTYGVVENGTTGLNNTYRNNLVFGNGTNWSLQNGLTHTGTVTQNPSFANYLANGSGDYHLAAGSPAINSGLSASYVPATDYEGVTRPQGAAPDIGAYEKAGAGSTGLVAWWKLNETSGTTAVDSSGSGNNGTLVNGPVWTTGKIGNAVSFAGGSDAINIGDPANGTLDFGTGSFSYGMWVNVSQSVGTWDSPWWKGGGSDEEAGYDLELGTGPWSANVSDGVTNKQVVFGNETLNRWVHIVAVVDRRANQLRAHQNGTLIQSTDITGLGSVSSASGAVISLDGTPFKGKVDDVRIYNRALSATEVIDLYAWRSPRRSFRSSR